jgi:oligosaccharide repeat unit polymerase
MPRSRTNVALAPQEGSGLRMAPAPTIVLHPLILFSAVWLGVLFLYSLRLSYILRYTAIQAFSLVFWIWLPFAVTTGVYTFFHQLDARYYPVPKKPWDFDLSLLRRRLKIALYCWILVAIAQVIISGGVPIVWALTGSSKTYIDFGLRSIHGFVISLETAISLCYVVLFLVTKKRSDLKVPFFLFVWAIVIINRNLMLVTLLEIAVVYMRLRRVRFATFAQIGTGVLVFVLAFGVIGDLRQGSNSLFRDLAAPTESYPEWLPSGVLWAYIYITTPINNLIYTVESNHPTYDPLFPSTISTLFPSVIRVVIYGDSLGDAESGSLVVSTFNVSTAYVGPFQDFGYIGTTLFSSFTAFLTLFFWFRNDLRSILMFAVVSQCLILTLFFDHFFYLPVITQLGWLWFFFSPQRAPFFVPQTWKKPVLTAVPR